jgi:uncharacterized protein (DUF885 family)
MSSSKPLAQLASRYWAFQKEETPITAIMAGQAAEGDLLLREAPADHERRAGWAAMALEELEGIDPLSLSLDDRATHALLGREFELLVELVGSNAHLRPPLYPLGPDFALQYWAGATALATVEEAEQYVARLRTIPDALDGIRASLAAGNALGYSYPKLVIRLATAQSRGALAVPVEAHPFAAPLMRIAERSPALARLAQEGRAIIAHHLYPAFHAFADFVEQALGATARDGTSCLEDKDGEAYYRYWIRTATTLDTAEAGDIHALGIEEVARIRAEMVKVCGGDLDSFRERLRGDSRQFAESGEALREQIEILSKRIDARIPEFFGRVPRMTYGVRSIPEAIAEKMPPAYAQPGPADRSAAGVHWVTSIPGKCPRHMHVPLAMHEAWPGHLMHLALIQEMEHLPDFRRYGALRYSACLEGWALYCEGLGAEMGFYDSPEKRYGRLDMEMWRAVRLVVDTGIHAKGWSRNQAIAFFEEHLAMPRSTVEAEVDRYIGWPGQALAYQLGNLRFRAIRQKAETFLGDLFDIRRFHDALMAAGPVTLPVLEQLMAAWTGGESRTVAP